MPSWATIIIAILASVTAPLIVVYFTNRQRKSELLLTAEIRAKEKEEDYRREDEVSARAKEAAENLLAAQQETIRKTDEVARAAARQAASMTVALQSITEQTRDIHTLVNSDMTAARQLALDQMRATRHALIRAAGPDPNDWTQEDKETIASLDRRITEQIRILADRLAAFKRVEAAEAGDTRGGE